MDGAAIPLKSLRRHLSLLLAAALLAAVATVAALHFGGQTAQVHRQALVLQGETQARLARVHEDERAIRARIARYRELVESGRIAPERRQEWAETLRHLGESRKLLGLDYEIAPQRPLDEKRPEAGGHLFLASAMRLEMPLLHEDDLLGLIADLKRRASAIVSVRSCTIERLPGAGALQARCLIDWITLQEQT